MTNKKILAMQRRRSSSIFIFPSPLLTKISVVLSPKCEPLLIIHNREMTHT